MRAIVGHAGGAERDLLRGLLEPLGWEVRLCCDGAEVLAACVDWVPDVAVLDGRLSGPGGVPLVTSIKAHPAAYQTAVVLTVADAGIDEIAELLRLGAHDVLVEPLRPGEVLARVDAAMRTKQLQEELLGQARRIEQLIYEDPLTGLHNRRFLFGQLSALVSGARRHGRPLSVVMIDIDHFKALNDTFGHEVGDRVLVAVAKALRARLRAEDTLGRLGGEEFLAVLTDADVTGAGWVAEALRQCASAVVVHVRGQPVQVTVSVGWATWAGEEPDQLVRRADGALYAAKAAGRDVVRSG